MVNKILRAREIQLQQRQFVAALFLARRRRLRIYYLDETSVSVWSPKLTKCFTDGSIKLPLQSKRGRSRTIIGAVGGDYQLGLVHWIYTTAESTNTEAVYAFLTELLNEA